MKNLRSFKRGAVGGPSSMTMEHLRPLLESPVACCCQCPQEVKDGFRLGRMTALAKPDGGVRGIVAGDVIRRLAARTIAQQLGKACGGLHSTVPVSPLDEGRLRAHTLQANPEASVISVMGSVHSIWCPELQCWKVSTLSRWGGSIAVCSNVL